MAAALNEINELDETPIHTDQLIAFHNSRLWQLCIGLFILLALALVDRIHEHWRPPDPPFVLTVNEQGHPTGRVLPILSVQAIPDAWRRAWLGDLIHDAFSIDRDSAEENRIFERAKSQVTGQAAQRLDAWYHRDSGTHYPKYINAVTWVDVNVADTLQLHDRDSYEVEYVTTTHEHNDTKQTVEQWRATIHVIVGRSKDPENLGVFADELDIEQVKP